MVVNGEEVEINSTNLTQLLTELGIENKLIAIEVNQNIIPRTEYSSFNLKNSDKVEIINAVGGG